MHDQPGRLLVVEAPPDAAGNQRAPPLPEGFLEGLVAASLKLPARVWTSALDGLVAFDDAADLGQITAPTVLIWGDQDAVVSREEQQRLEDAIPDARLKLYPDTGHSPHWERPEAVAADLATDGSQLSRRPAATLTG